MRFFHNHIGYFLVVVDYGLDGGWTEWTSWSKCSSKCGEEGTTTRTRKCEIPASENGGQSCSGDSKQQRTCTTFCTSSRKSNIVLINTIYI